MRKIELNELEQKQLKHLKELCKKFSSVWRGLFLFKVAYFRQRNTNILMFKIMQFTLTTLEVKSGYEIPPSLIYTYINTYDQCIKAINRNLALYKDYLLKNNYLLKDGAINYERFKRNGNTTISKP